MGTRIGVGARTGMRVGLEPRDKHALQGLGEGAAI